MDKIFIFAFMSFVGSAASAASSLTDCSLQGWDRSRLPQKKALELKKQTDGSCHAHFRLNPDDKKINDGVRAEIKDPFVVLAGQKTSHSFSIYVPSSIKKANVNRMVLAQWHDYKSPKPPFVRRPPLSLRYDEGALHFILFNDEIYNSQATRAQGVTIGTLNQPYDRWIHLQIVVRWSAEAAGFVSILQDQNLVTHYQGPIGYQDHKLATYFKVGPYTVHPFQKSVEIFVKNYLFELENSPIRGEP